MERAEATPAPTGRVLQLPIALQLAAEVGLVAGVLVDGWIDGMRAHRASRLFFRNVVVEPVIPPWLESLLHWLALGTMLAFVPLAVTGICALPGRRLPRLLRPLLIGLAFLLVWGIAAAGREDKRLFLIGWAVAGGALFAWVPLELVAREWLRRGAFALGLAWRLVAGALPLLFLLTLASDVYDAAWPGQTAFPAYAALRWGLMLATLLLAGRAARASEPEPRLA